MKNDVTKTMVAKIKIVEELNKFMIKQTHNYKLLRNSKLFSANFSQAPQIEQKLSSLKEKLVDCKKQVEKLILGTLSVEDI